MNKVIDSQAVIDAINSHFGFNIEEEYGSAVQEVINDLPPAQLEHETATWIIDSAYPQHCWCSNCNHRFDLFDPKSIHFCPNCGREMKTCVWKSLDEREEE